MKTVLFTHKDDIDGAGCEVLLKAAFGEKNVEVFPCSYGDLDEKISKFIDSGALNSDDVVKVFVTDMCPKQETMEKIAGEENCGKFQIIDHHDHPIDFYQYEYFFFSQQRDDFGLCSATSLFYNWLVAKGNLSPSKALNEFTERTRRSDTWEWKTIYDDTMADDMSELFNSVGYDKYVKSMFEKVKNNSFEFSDEEKEIIAERREKIAKAYQTALEKLKERKVCNVDGVKVAVVDIEYEFRSGFSQYLRDINYPADIMAIADFDNNRMSYRYLNPQVDVGAFARKFGGGGRNVAAGSPINQQIIDALGLETSEKGKN